MTNKLKCPFCSEELTIQPRKVANFEIAVCRNPVCEYAGWHLPVDVFVRLIDGKKAQDKLDKVDTMLFSLILKAHDLTALDLLQGITDIRLKIIKFITKQEE